MPEAQGDMLRAPTSSFRKILFFLTAALFLLAGGSPLPARQDCNFNASKIKNSKEITLKDGVVRLGTIQVGAKNQDPIVAWFKDGKQVFCRSDYDASSVDARAVAATADAQHLYVAFSADGGATEEHSFARFTRAGWLATYGKGGGAKVVVLLKLRKSDGEAVTGTYLTARKADGTTNSVALKKFAYIDGAISVEAEAWSSPLRADRSTFECTGKPPFPYSLALTSDLKAVTFAGAVNCR